MLRWRAHGHHALSAEHVERPRLPNAESTGHCHDSDGRSRPSAGILGCLCVPQPAGARGTEIYVIKSAAPRP